MPSQLFFVNLPYNCSDRELREWIESRGIDIGSIRIIRDVVSGASPAFGYADLKETACLADAVILLNGKKMRNQIIAVKPAPLQRAASSAAGLSSFRKPA